MLLHLEALHFCGRFLHVDIKPDNWCICNDGVDADVVSDVMLIDYGRAKDLDVLMTKNNSDEDGSCSNSLFGSVVADEDLECVAMRENREWSFDVDCYGLCVSAHTLLFGEYMDIEKADGSDGVKWKLKRPLRRYWQRHLWDFLFNAFINIDVEVYEETLHEVKRAFGEHLQSRMPAVKQILENQNRGLPRRK